MGLYRHTFSLLGFDEGAPPTERNQTFLEFWTQGPPMGPRIVDVQKFSVAPHTVDIELQSRLSMTDIRSIVLRYTFDGERFTLAPQHKTALAELRAREAKP
jgi:hypothetical protein